MPFETDSPALSYFFDCGIIVRGLLAAWRVSRSAEFLDCAVAVGRSMERDFRAADGWHPILTLPAKMPAIRDAASWSRMPGCYQLKSAMAWCDLSRATGDTAFRELYQESIAPALANSAGFLPDPAGKLKTMDRLHAYLYFLEGLMPAVKEARCALALGGGIRQVRACSMRLSPSSRAPMFTRNCCGFAFWLTPREPSRWIGKPPRRGAGAGGVPGRLRRSAYRRRLLVRPQERRVAAPRQPSFDGVRHRSARSLGAARRRHRSRPAADLMMLLAYAAARLAGWARPVRRDAGSVPLAANTASAGISVVIPSRNGKALLEAQLAGIAADLASVSGEIIVIDNGSSDGTAEWLRGKYPQIVIEVSPEPLSFAGAVNRGIRRARFSHVCLLNNDMRIEPGFFAALLEAFANGAGSVLRHGADSLSGGRAPRRDRQGSDGASRAGGFSRPLRRALGRRGWHLGAVRQRRLLGLRCRQTARAGRRGRSLRAGVRGRPRPGLSRLAARLAQRVRSRRGGGASAPGHHVAVLQRRATRHHAGDQLSEVSGARGSQPAGFSAAVAAGARPVAIARRERSGGAGRACVGQPGWRWPGDLPMRRRFARNRCWR